MYKMVESLFSKFMEDKVRMFSKFMEDKVKGTWLDSVLRQREEGMQHGLRRKYCLYKHRLRVKNWMRSS
ncbi:hypothetical protein Tco_0399190 [Tanacetum coccineum]